MNKYLKNTTLAISLVASHQATAMNFECKLDASTRTISVNFPEQKSLPCQVQYTKEGNTQTLWQANNTEGYCEERAREFVAKHESWGWQCASQHITPQADTQESADSPAE